MDNDGSFVVNLRELIFLVLCGNLEKFKLFCSIRVRAVNTGISKRREDVYRKVNFGHNLMATLTCCMKNAVELAKNGIESALQRHFHDEILL